MKLSTDFLSTYKGITPQFGPIGEIVYLRTYSRWDEEKKRRENWDETVTRTVDWSAGLAEEVTQQESEQLFDLWWGLKGFPAGRSLWVGGTEYSKNKGFGQFNCSFLDIKSPSDFSELTYLLMSGSGVGFRVTNDNISELQRVNPIVGIKPILHIKEYEYVGIPKLREETEVRFEDGKMFIDVGDSREGWSAAIQKFVEAFSVPLTDIYVNVDYVRPLGSRLSTFGGQASGPEPLIAFFKDSHRVIWDGEQRWTSVKALDIANMVGRTVVAGGSRRSAQLALGDFDDKEYANAKTGDWHKTAPWRSQSNNTVVFKRKPTQSELEYLFERIMQYGEPGFLNEEAAQERRPGFRGLNPCGEILLDNKGLCNLTTINLMGFVNGHVDMTALEKAVALQVRHNLRVTNIQLELDKWNKVQKRDRLLGLSFTGFGDMVDHLNLSEHDQTKLLKRLKRVARQEANRYADEIGVPRPLLATTVKPEGTLTQLPGVSSGIHPNFGPHHIRRVRISEVDAVSAALIESGFPYEKDAFNSNTLVFSFPIKTPAKKYASDYSAIEMLERYKMIMDHYVEHNCSVTVYVGNDEVDGVIDWLLKNWDSYVAVSFLPKEDKAYDQMPYEKISIDQYTSMIKDLPLFSREVLDSVESKFTATDDLENSCVGGACPVR